MVQYLVQPRDLFVKGYRFFTFNKNMDKNVGKNISKNLSGKNSQKLLDHAKQSAPDVLKTTSKRAIQKTVNKADDLIGNKIADRITKVSKTSQQNNSETVTNDNDKEIPKERIYLQKKDRKPIMI